MRIQDAILYGSKRGSGSGPTPSGSIEISENGTYDVTEKAEAVVDVEPDLTTKQITQNGTYQASSDNADGYSAVTVAVPQPSGTKQVTISQNGTTTEDVEDYENAQITVNVPGPSGKIMISQNANDIDVSGYALADVNVSGGANKEGGIIDGTLSGDYVNNDATIVKEYKFKDMRKITSVTLNSATAIEGNGFFGCTNLRSANIPLVTTLGYNAFTNCNLKNIILPNVTIIDGSAFNSNYALASVDCSKKVSIGNNAFSNCWALDTLILRDTSELSTTSSSSNFNSTKIKNGTGYIYVPAALVDSYKAATNWSTFAAQFRALEDYTVDGTTTGDLDPTKI